MTEELKFNLTKDETEITVNVALFKHPEHNTTDVIVEFPNGIKFITTVTNREYEDEQRALIGRTIYNIVYRQLKIEKEMLTRYIYEKGLLLSHKGPPKHHFQGTEREEFKEKERKRQRELYRKRKALKTVSPGKA
jgi:hypothetical protein